LRTGRSLKEKVDWKFRDLSEQLSLQAMSTTASVALEFLRVQNASEANGTVVNGCTSLEFCPGKQLAKPRCMLSFANALNMSGSFIFRSAPAICCLSRKLSSVCVLIECFG
jgi:hypothetical protein